MPVDWNAFHLSISHRFGYTFFFKQMQWKTALCTGIFNQCFSFYPNLFTFVAILKGFNSRGVFVQSGTNEIKAKEIGIYFVLDDCKMFQMIDYKIHLKKKFDDGICAYK